MATDFPYCRALSRRAFVRQAGVLAAAPWLLHAGQATATERSGDLIGETTFYLTKPDDNLLDVARARNLGMPEISAVNPGVDPWVPGAEKLIVLPTQFILPDAPREGIVVNYGELRLFYFPKQGPIQTYAIGVGRDGFELKMGKTRIVRKTEHPTWYPTESVLRDKPWVGKVVPPGPDNPLGDFAMYLGWPTYLIHGTNKPYGVGRRVSRGCIRMYPEGVAQLYPQIPVGTKVTAVEQFVKVGWHEGELYLEAQPDIVQVDELEADLVLTARQASPEDRQLVIDRAGPELARVDWQIVEAELVARRGIPVQVTRPGPAVAEAGGAAGRGMAASMDSNSVVVPAAAPAVAAGIY